jgi:hypothetical protein
MHPKERLWVLFFHNKYTECCTMSSTSTPDV